MSTEVETPEEAAERRRRTWTGGVARSWAEMEEVDLRFWLGASHAQRVRAVTELGDLFVHEDTHEASGGAEVRSSRAVGGVRARRG